MTIPNLITVFRFLLVPATVWAILGGRMEMAFWFFLVAGVSDAVDGFIARQFGQWSELGAYLDPIADKLLLVSIFVMLAYKGLIPDWLVIMVVTRDALIVGGVMLAAVMENPVAMRPLFVSKATTAAQLALATLVLAEQAFIAGPDWLRGAAIAAVAILTAASAAAYLITWFRHMGGNGEGNDQD